MFDSLLIILRMSFWDRKAACMDFWCGMVVRTASPMSCAKKKHAKKFSIKNLGAPKTPSKFFMQAFFLCFEGKKKRGPKHKEFAGSGVGGLGGGVSVSAQILPSCLLCPFLVTDDVSGHAGGTVAI